MKREKYEIFYLPKQIKMQTVEDRDGAHVSIHSRKKGKRKREKTIALWELVQTLPEIIVQNQTFSIVIKHTLLNAVKNVKQINGRVMSLTSSSHGYDVTMIAAQ